MPNVFFIYLFMVVFAFSSTSAVSSLKRDNNIRTHLLKMHPFLKHRVLSKSMRDLLFHSPTIRKRRMDYLKDNVPLVTKSSFFWEEFNKDQQGISAEINNETTPHSLCFEHECTETNNVGTRDAHVNNSTKRSKTSNPQATFQVLEESDIMTTPSLTSQHDKTEFIYKELTTKNPLEVENVGEVGENQVTTSSYEGDPGTNLGSYNVDELRGKLIEGFTAFPNSEENKVTEEYEEPTSTQNPNLLDVKRHYGFDFQSAYVLPTQASFSETSSGDSSSTAGYKSFGDSENPENKENSNAKNVEAILNSFNGSRMIQSSQNLPESTSSVNFEQNTVRAGQIGFVDSDGQNGKGGSQNVTYVVDLALNRNVSKNEDGAKISSQNTLEGVANSFLNSSAVNSSSNFSSFYTNVETSTKPNLKNVSTTILITSTQTTVTIMNKTNSGQTTVKHIQNVTTSVTKPVLKNTNCNVTSLNLNSDLNGLVSIQGKLDIKPASIPIFGSLKPVAKNTSSSTHDFSKVVHKTTSELKYPSSFNPQKPISKLLIVPDYVYNANYPSTMKPFSIVTEFKSPTIRSNDPDFVVDLSPDPNPNTKKSKSEIVINDVETFPLKPKSEEKTSSTGSPKLNLIQKLIHNFKGFVFHGTTEKSPTGTTLGDHSKKRCAKSDEDAVARELVNVLKDVKSIKQDKLRNKTGDCELSGSWMSELAGRRVEIKPDLTTKLKRNFLKRKWGFMGGGKWNATVRRPFANHKNYVILVAVERSEKLIATFLGECLICRQREIIQGDWMFTRHSRDCESLGATAQLLGDVWRRDTLADVKGQMSETTHKTTTTESCKKAT